MAGEQYEPTVRRMTDTDATVPVDLYSRRSSS